MKKVIFLLISLFILQATAQSTLTTKQWQEDLRFLQNTIHTDYSFLFVKTTKEIFDTEIETLYKNIPNLEEHEIIVGMSRIIALFKYGHTDISFRQKPFEFHYNGDFQVYLRYVKYQESTFLGLKKRILLDVIAPR